ncbi:MAG: hypothetical protein DRP14_05360 [Candidatus Aenigmatarchaeota archaeon]|nr:MAG: hypothetical protein DRP14_05360 [Candidatus Aenigmarchaeota archaeon]
MKLDQHFIIDTKVLLKIAELAKIKKNEIVLEIGAGTGNLTKLLLNKARFVYAIEKDEKLFSELKKINNKKLKPILGNALKINFPNFDKLVADIPYSISEPLIQRLIYEDFKLAVLLFPENFVKTLLEKNTKLSLISKLFFEIKLDQEVFPESFYPKPKVLSRIVLIKPKITEKHELIFREFIKQRDKKAKNALREAIIRGYGKTKREVRNILKDFEIDKKVASLNLKELKKIRKFVNSLNF